MSTRTLQQIIPSVATTDGGGVRLRRSLGQSQTLRVDPFLLLDEFSSVNPDDYIAGFPDHPHRGFETLTYMLDGHMLHEDYMGNRGDLKAGGAQWMRAGRGIIHSEMPQQVSGRMRGFQLWINLPAREKMNPASYQDVTAEQIPVFHREDGGNVKIIAGTADIEGTMQIGAIQGISTQPVILDVTLPENGYYAQEIAEDQNALIYLYEGSVQIGPENDQHTLKPQAAGVLSSGNEIQLRAGDQGATFLLIAARPLREPIVQYGPFVMNTREEIEQTLADYKNGLLVE